MVDMPQVNPVLTQQPEVQLDSAIFKRGDAMSTGQGMQALAQGLNAYGEAQVKSQIAGIERTGKLGEMAIGAVGSLAGKMKENSNDFEMTFQRDADGNLQPAAGGSGGGFDLGGMLGAGGADGGSFFGAPSTDQGDANNQGPKASEAYGHAITVTNKAAAQTIINENLNNLANQFQDDPAQFQVAAGKYADSFLQQGYPEAVSQGMWSHAVTQASQYHIGLVNKKRERDLNSGYQDLITRNKDLTADLHNVAFGTPADTPEFIEKSPEWKAYKENLTSLQNSPYFNSIYTPTRVQHELDQTKALAVTKWAEGNVQRIRDMPGGGIDKARDWADKNILKANNHMPMEQREAAYNNAINRITTLTDEQKTRKAAATATADSFVEMYAKRLPPNEEQFNKAYNDAIKNFSPESAGRLLAARYTYDNFMKPAGGMSVQQGAAAIMGNPHAGGNGAPAIDKTVNFNQANKDMHLSAQEQYLYNEHLNNLWGPGGVDNEDGSRSTLYNTTVNVGGKERVLPTVWDGAKHTPSEAVERAKQKGLDNYPSYKTVQEAESRYHKMHDYMEKDVQVYQNNKRYGAVGSTDYANSLAQKYSGRSHGESEECVALVKHVAPGLGSTEHWSPAGGITAQTAPGTPIATFGGDGKYKNVRGQSHAAIYLGPGSEPGSIRVLDQWNGHPAAERTIKVGNTAESAQNFQVIKGASGTPLADNGVRHPFGIGQNYSPGIGSNPTMGLIQHFEGFREGAYWDVNHHRVGYGSDTITHADGRIEEVGPNSRVTREDAERDLQRRVGHIQTGIAGDIGQENWNRLPEGAKAALTSFGYNYGSLRGDVAAAARSGDPNAIAHAIMAHSGDNNGINRRRREMEASVAMGGQVPSGVPGGGGGRPYVTGPNSPLPYTAEEMDRMPWLASTAAKMMSGDTANTISYAKEQMNMIGEGFKYGVVPTSEKLAELQQIANTHPKELAEDMTKLQAKADAAPLALQAAGVEGGGEALKAHMNEEARKYPDLYHMELAKQVGEQFDGRAKQIKDDPHAYAARSDVGWTTRAPTPFSAMANPQQLDPNATPLDVFDGSLMQHRQAGIALMNHGVTKDAAAATFPDKTIADMGSYLSSANGQQAEAFVAGLKTRLTDQEFDRLASDKNFSGVVSGLTRSTDPQKVTAGYMFLERAYQQNPFAFDAEHKGQRERMSYWNSAVRFMGYDEAKRILMQDAASAGSDAVMDKKRKDVREQLADYDSTSVIKQLTTSVPFMSPNGPLAPSDVDFGSAQVLSENWKRMVENYYVAGNDIGTAKNQATEAMRKYYGTSAFNGGRIMLAPPENVYKTPQEMMAFTGQFNKFVVEQAHTSGVHVQGSTENIGNVNLDASVLSDAQTLDSLAARQPPSYAVQIKDPKSGLTHLLVGQDGKPVRFQADMQDPVYGLDPMQKQDINFYQNTPRWKRAMERGPGELFKGAMKFGASNG